MTSRRSSTVDYTTQCTVIITYVDGDRQDRLIYERPQPQIPDGPLTTFDRIRLSQFPTDDELDIEAKRIFSDMKSNNRIGNEASLSSIFIARTAVAAVEMGLWRLRAPLRWLASTLCETIVSSGHHSCSRRPSSLMALRYRLGRSQATTPHSAKVPLSARMPPHAGPPRPSRC